jgi:hypothetical protein
MHDNDDLLWDFLVDFSFGLMRKPLYWAVLIALLAGIVFLNTSCAPIHETVGAKTAHHGYKNLNYYKTR